MDEAGEFMGRGMGGMSMGLIERHSMGALLMVLYLRKWDPLLRFSLPTSRQWHTVLASAVQAGPPAPRC